MNVADEPDPEGFEPGEHDRDHSNILLRAGYLRGMAMKFPVGSDDRLFLLRASRSLLAYAASFPCRKEKR